MKKTLQFIIPMLLLVVGGFVLMYMSNPSERDKRLHIRCNNSIRHRRSYRVSSAQVINFMQNHDECSLEIEIINVGETFVRINTPSLLHTDQRTGEVNEDAPRREVTVEASGEVILYSLDQQTKYTFEYR